MSGLKTINAIRAYLDGEIYQTDIDNYLQSESCNEHIKLSKGECYG